MPVPHRKRIKHYEEERHVHELTFSCFERRPLLTNNLWRTWFCEGLDRGCERQRFRLLAYVVMPEHVHLLVWPNDYDSRIEHLLTDIKRPFSRRVKGHLSQTSSPLLQKLTVRQRPNVMSFRFWQEGPGYDRNVTDARSILAGIEYIHANPVRRGLCVRAVDWPWSSTPRLLIDGALTDLPRLSRFDPQMMCIASAREHNLEKHC